MLGYDDAWIEDALRDGSTLLYLAVLGGHTDVVDLLLVNGALVGAVNGCGEYLLHLAATRGHGDIVHLLNGYV